MNNAYQNMPLLPECHTILGAGGVIASELMRELATRVEHVRLVCRHPSPPPLRMEARATDLLNPQQVADVVSGSTVAYLVAGLPYRVTTWEQQWPIIMRNVIDACKRHKTALVFLDNLYLYGNQEDPISENSPVNPCSKKGELRAKLSAMLKSEMQAGNLQALIARAADFYGPGATKSFIHPMVFELLRDRRKAVWLGHDNVEHSLIFTPDAGRALATLGTTRAAYGQVWLLPCHSPAPTGRDFIEAVAHAFRVRPAYRVLGSRTLRAAGFFHSFLRETAEMLYQYTHPYVVDSSKFSRHFFPATPMTEAIRTIEQGMIYPRT